MEYYRRFNAWLANRLANALGSMEFFYICVVMDLVELPPVIRAHDIIVWITYVAQTVIQLIALPIISTQQRLQSQKHNELMQAHRELHDHIKKIHKHLGIKE